MTGTEIETELDTPTRGPQAHQKRVVNMTPNMKPHVASFV